MITQTYTDPSTGGAIDLDADETLAAAVWDYLISNIKHLGGTAAAGTCVTARGGIVPKSKWVMGCSSADTHTERGTVSITPNAGRSANAAITFSPGFTEKPTITITPEVSSAADVNTGEAAIYAAAGTGFRLLDQREGGNAFIWHWTAIGLTA